MDSELAAELDAWIAEAEQKRVTEWEKRTKDRKAFRADHAERRAYGLIARQRTKLQHIQERLL